MTPPPHVRLGRLSEWIGTFWNERPGADWVCAELTSCAELVRCMSVDITRAMEHLDCMVEQEQAVAKLCFGEGRQ